MRPPYALGMLLLGSASMGVAAAFAPTMVIAIPLAVAFVVATFKDLAAGLAVLVLLTFFEQFSAGVSIVKVAGAILVAAWLIELLQAGDRSPFLFRDQPALAYLLVSFVVWSGLSVLWAVDAERAMASVIRLAQVVLLVFVVFTAIKSAKHLRWIVLSVVAGAAVTASYGIASGASLGDSQRLLGGIGDPNELAAILVPAAVFAVFLLQRRLERPIVRLILLLFLGVSAVSLFLTESRGGLIALGAASFAAIIWAGPARARITPLIAAVGVAAIVYTTGFASAESRERLGNLSAEGSAGRTDQWQLATAVADDHPILGVGLDNFILLENQYVSADVNVLHVGRIIDFQPLVHNTYLEVLAELGAVGLALFGAIIVVSLAATVSAAKRVADQGDDAVGTLVRAVGIGVIATLVAFTFLSALYEKQLWLMLGLAASTVTLARVAPERAAARPELAGLGRPVRPSGSFGAPTPNLE